MSSLLIAASHCHLGGFETCRRVHHAEGWLCEGGGRGTAGWAGSRRKLKAGPLRWCVSSWICWLEDLAVSSLERTPAVRVCLKQDHAESTGGLSLLNHDKLLGTIFSEEAWDTTDRPLQLNGRPQPTSTLGRGNCGSKQCSWPRKP